MKILIIEDENPAAKRLQKLILDCRPDSEILDTLDSLEQAVKWLRLYPAPDLIFMDIQLADGLSFSIFNQVKIKTPVIFTTAFDQYMLKAFKVNSIDYLLKPIDFDDLCGAFDQFDELKKSTFNPQQAAIERLIHQFQKPTYKERFLVKIGQQLHHIAVKDIAFFHSESGIVHTHLTNGKKHIVDYTLDQLAELVDPNYYFRINRKIITHIDAIQKIHTYFNSRLKLELAHSRDMEIIVSRDRVSDFKQWLDR